jgi:hypothetical protein
MNKVIRPAQLYKIQVNTQPTTNLMFIVEFIELFLHMAIDVFFRPVQHGVPNAYHFSLRTTSNTVKKYKNENGLQQQL